MTTLNRIKEVLLEEKNKMLKLGINKVGVFGSYLNGNIKENSDIDILIDITPDSSLTLFSLIDLELNLSEKLDTKIDLVIKSDLKPNIGKRILSEVQYV
jgi:uncharacterized protein